MKANRNSVLRSLLSTAWLTWASFLSAEAAGSGALWLPYWQQDDGVLPTYGTSVAVDSRGGIHVAYCIYLGADLGGTRPAIYAYCPSNSIDRANWSFVALGDNVQDTRLALDPHGRPRLMLFGPAGDPEAPERMRYQYAECNAGWTDPSNWTITTVVTPLETVATREYDNNRYFAISPQGTAAFIHTEKVDEYHEYPVYMSCSGDCTDPRNWSATVLTSNYIDQPSLTFSPDGHPRLAFGLFQGTDLFLAYAECNGDSSDPDQWVGVVLTQIHGSANYSLQSDAAGRPRIAFSSGSYAAAPFADRQLYYLWCTDGDIADPANWRYDDVGVGGSSGGVDLALDGQGRPRISYQEWEGLGFAWSNNNVESGEGGWEHRIVESDASLAANYEVLPITRCTLSSWNNGQRSSLALGRDGNPRIGYDAEHTWSGTYLDPPWGNCNFKDVTITRFAFFSMGTSLSIQRIGNNVTIVFENGVLESAPAIAGPWSPLSAATSPLLLPAEGQQRFYRLRE